MPYLIGENETCTDVNTCVGIGQGTVDAPLPPNILPSNVVGWKVKFDLNTREPGSGGESGAGIFRATSDGPQLIGILHGGPPSGDWGAFVPIN
jgi:hypothetical protein